ncbi:putative cytosolic protein [Lactococcus raffinolactis]|nr:putative cytosolic protein [Lactococcus raffinolactis]
MKAAEDLYALEVEMKVLAKEAVLYKKIDKVKAYQETMARSKIIEAQLNESPLIMDYRRKLVVANDLLQHLLQTLESQINEELYRDK